MAVNDDFTGNTVYVNDIVYGCATPGVLSGTTLSSTISTIQSSAIAPKSINANAATLAPTSAQTGSTITFNRAAGCTVTLPTPVVGTTYTFVVGTVTTGGNVYKVITSAGTVFLAGGVNFDKSLTVTRYAADGSTIVSINLNGTTTGGATIGDSFTVTCVSATEWSIQGTVTASGTLATPFATS